MEQAADASEREPRRRFHLPRPHLPHGLVTFPRRLLPWIEPWFLAYACLGVAFLSGIGRVPLALAGFVVLVLAWPLLGVSGTALTAQLAPGEKGEALGLFNACSSLAGAVGAFVGGWAMDLVGYGALCMAGAVVVGLAALLSGGENRHVAAPLDPVGR
jgi:predicted MFS family arabinose efflux permease